MKKKRLEKKKRKRVRTKDWEDKHEYAFTHDLVKHRRASVKLSETAADSNPLPKDFEPNAVVISHTKKFAFVELDGEEKLCIIDERLKEDEATLLAPGDHVLVEFEDADAIVRGVGPRRTKLSRPSGEESRLDEQVLAANADVLIVVAAAARPPFREGLVDRYLIAAERGGVEPLLCVNKMDLVESEPATIGQYRELGVRVINASCETGAGIPEMREALSGKISVLAGHSGVGKSSLLNALVPELTLQTQEVTRGERGRHTTTSARLYMLPNKIRIIDTPGIRALGLWGVTPEEVAYYFPEIGERALGCKYRNCTHIHEPQCGVRDAFEAGDLSPARYASYLRIRASLENDRGVTPGRVSVQHSGRDLPF